MKVPGTGFRGEMLTLLYAIRHRSTPVLPKIVALLSLLYLLSPIDLIPDFIPFAGWLDDLVLVPLLLHISYRLLPGEVVRESRLKAAGQRRRLRLVALVILAGILVFVAAACWFYHTRQ